MTEWVAEEVVLGMIESVPALGAVEVLGAALASNHYDHLRELYALPHGASCSSLRHNNWRKCCDFQHNPRNVSWLS